MCLRPLLFAAAAVLVGVAARSEIVPVEKFTGGVFVSRAQLSPNGRYLACLREIQGELRLVITDLETEWTGAMASKRGDAIVTEISDFEWIGDDRLAFLSTTWDGLYYTAVTATDWNGRNQLEISGLRNSVLSTEILHAFNDEERSVLMIDNGDNEGRSATFPDVVRVVTKPKNYRFDVLERGSLNHFARSVAPPAPVTVAKNPGNVVDWICDAAGVVKLGITRDGLRYGAIFRANAEEPWRKLPLFDEAKGFIQPLGLDASGSQLIVAADNEDGRRAVYAYDVEKGVLGAPLASDPKFDIIPARGGAHFDGVPLCAPIHSASSRAVIGCRFLDAGPRTHWLAPRFEALQTAINRLLPQTANVIVSTSRDERRFLILAFSDRDPGRYYLLDLRGAKPKLTFQGERLQDFPVAQMAPMFPIEYRARDGEAIAGYLTFPAAGGKQDLPLVVLPHGGPIARDFWGFDPLVQFLANRGYAVLQMNYRGSSGYGSEFVAKGREEIGRRIQSDIADGVQWAIARKIADPRRIAIVGASFGGYSALYALGHQPELYRCGISISGVTDWSEFITQKKGEEYSLGYLHWRKWLGTDDLNAAVLREISPVHFAEAIKAPLLLVHGKEDRTVPFAQARALVDALRAAGRPPGTLFLGGAGHYIADRDERTKVFREIERFLARNLTGPAQ